MLSVNRSRSHREFTVVGVNQNVNSHLIHAPSLGSDSRSDSRSRDLEAGQSDASERGCGADLEAEGRALSESEAADSPRE